MFLLVSPHKRRKEVFFFSEIRVSIDLSNFMAWTVALRKHPCSKGTGRNLGKTVCLCIPSETEQGAMLGCSHPGCWEPSMPGCLQHPRRWIAAASSCPLSSPENNEANNFFNYLLRAASSVNKFVWLSPGSLAFDFIGFFHMHLKHVLFGILISTGNFLAFPTFLIFSNFLIFV